MAQNQTFRLPLSVISAQLTISAGHTVLDSDIELIEYNALALPQPTVRVTLRPILTNFLKTIEFFTFNRSQVVNFYNNISGGSVVASTINDIRFDPIDPGSFIELVPPQT